MHATHSNAMSFTFPRGVTADFDVELAQAPALWDVKCNGTLDVADAAAVLQPRLLQLHSAAMEAGVPVVRLHLENVEYINSSGLKAFMTWFLAASNAKDCKYTIEVVYDPERSWQMVSLRPMERLAPERVKLVSK